MRVLLVTVGGSPEPIRSTWNHLHPDKTYFICSEDDPYSKHKGSYVEVGNGQDGKLAASLGLSPEQFEVIQVPADRPDQAYGILHNLIDNIYQRTPEAQIAVDYTGGTKSMSASLFAAAVEYREIDIYMVTGTRADFEKVRHGTHYPRQVAANTVRFEREFRLALQFWESYDYEAAAKRLQQLIAGRQPEPNVYQAQQVSRALSLWDRFQYEQAYECLRFYAGSIPFVSQYTEQVHFLLETERPVRRDYLRIWDLWFNALRRAERGRYDDGVARLYRLVEATAQWQLQHSYHIDTSQVQPAQLPSGFRHDVGTEPVKMGLFEAWRLLREIDTGPLSKWFIQEESHLRQYLNIRNDSYLAHGHQPVSEEEWKKWREWLENSFLPAFHEQGQQHGIKKIPRQLPTAWLEKV
ncbi:TIGR02710 family CRISPR-associated CARF protein [Sulfobacillus thermosulfidooxidans]|uniref:TIGR02710 family CRISPR-associated CARF protein n=1 Tax=Sulfobacillus thermosulfidooxidans TaxID=28034 RepID=UPI0006B5427B|nr:TIGR02710 family CRISPR-associated CARF protein [Sulfobacillus thermosulfidooxidans]